jgi:hypothetical protein
MILEFWTFTLTHVNRMNIMLQFKNGSTSICCSFIDQTFIGDIFESYCEICKLQVNVNKTKVMISCKNKFRRQFDFILQGQVLEIVDTYSYLGDAT